MKKEARPDFAQPWPYSWAQRWSEERPNDFALSAPRLGSTETSDLIRLTWRETFRLLQIYVEHLLSLNLQKGDRIAIWGRNSIEWVLLDWAASAAGLVTVPLYPQTHAKEAAYILAEAEVKYLFKDADFENPSNEVPSITFIELHDRLEKLQPSRHLVPRFLDPQEIFTLIYTSGTSGEPKGVMHRLASMPQVFEVGAPIFKFRTKDRYLAYLTLSHVAERVLIGYVALYSGAEITLLDKVERLPTYLPKVKPTLFFGVPRVWDLLRQKIEREISNQPLLHQRLQAIPFFIRPLILSFFLKRKLGFSRTRLFLSGAAKLSPQTAYAFSNWGISIQEGYGLTETLCASALNKGGRWNRVGTVGTTYSGVQVRIEIDGEICLKAPFHFLGYYKKPEATAAALRDGWFYTGDVGKLDRDGYLTITDRKKDIFKVSNGKYVAPQPIEALLRDHPGIQDVVVVGDGRNHCVALAAVSDQSWSEESYVDLLNRVNHRLAAHEQIKSIGCYVGTWSAGSGELTPTQKVKRKILMEKYAGEIEALYASRAKVQFFFHSGADLVDSERAHRPALREVKKRAHSG